jgi:hypothetical protein
MHTIKVEIDERGEVKIIVEGIAGDRCLLLTDQLARQLGVVLERGLTAEYFDDVQAAERLRTKS